MSKANGSSYAWLSPREHALKRPDTYAGGTNPIETEGYSFHVSDGGTLATKHERAMIAPAMMKVLDEAVQNAMDRPDRKLIRIACDASGTFSVSNDGRTIPVQLWEKSDRYTAEILFCELMSGDNFDDEVKRLDVGGRNGLGIKITALMSTEFVVECVCLEDSLLFEKSSQVGAIDLKKRASIKADAQDVRAFDGAPRFGGIPTLGVDADGGLDENTRFLLRGTVYANKGKLRYTQRFENNLAVIHPPEITRTTSKDRVSSTTVRFTIDLPRFGMRAPLDDATMGILRSRAYDVAAVTDAKVTVHLDDVRITVKGIKDYALALGGDWLGRDTVHADDGSSLDVLLLARASAPNTYTVGFVNGIRCAAGAHVDGVFAKLRDVVSDIVSKKLKRPIKVSAAQIRERMSVVVSARVINPSFTTQTKERLNTKADQVATYVPSKATCAALERSGVVRDLCDVANEKEDRAVSKSVKTDRHRVVTIPKYERALKLGNKKTPCQLYVTEGDSAKGLAVSGFSVIGRDHNGVFPLRGKLVNVNGMSVKASLQHKEIHHLTQILGLDPTVAYTEELVAALPYRHLVIFTDQDNDGSHIMGLVLNWLVCFYPTLLRAHPTFVKRFATPIVRARIGTETRSFFSQTEFHEWAAGRKASLVKYFKGLGTSTNEDAKHYFKHIDDHLITVKFDSDACKNAVDMWFDRQRSGERKAAVGARDVGYIDYAEDETTIRAFCDTELVRFGNAANERAIANVVDGLKPSQRKALFSTLSRKPGEVKVAQLAAGTAELTAYHHGEQSLVQTIVAMAQPWVGANNVALLAPNGMFGSRHMPREEHSAPRYIFTEAAKIARYIFPESDDAVLEMAEDDGKVVEPKLYAPIVPFLLVNGTEGIGSGWRSRCPPYSMEEILANTRLLASDPQATLVPMKPNFFGFKGTIVPSGTDYVFTGIYVVDGDRQVRITELPPKVWTGPYVDQLRESLVGDGADKFATSIDDVSTTDDVEIIIKLRAGVDVSKRDLVKDLDLSRKVTLADLNFWGGDGSLVVFSGPHDIMRAHAAFRRATYEKRRAHLLCQLSHDVNVARSKARFVREQNSGDVEPKKHTEEQLCALLAERGYYEHKKFEYLRGMSAFSCTIDHAARIDKQADALQEELDTVKATTVEMMWHRDLDRLESAYELYKAETLRKRSRDDEPSGGKKRQRGGAGAGPSRSKRRIGDVV